MWNVRDWIHYDDFEQLHSCWLYHCIVDCCDKAGHLPTMGTARLCMLQNERDHLTCLTFSACFFHVLGHRFLMAAVLLCLRQMQPWHMALHRWTLLSICALWEQVQLKALWVVSCCDSPSFQLHQTPLLMYYQRPCCIELDVAVAALLDLALMVALVVVER